MNLSDTPDLREDTVSENESENMPDIMTDEEFEERLQRFIESELNEDNTVAATEVVSDHNTTTPGEPSISISLSHLTGLSAVKEKLSTYEKVVKFNRLRIDNNLPANTQPLHAMFLGNPGTGKTTVAKMMGVMLRRAGMLRNGHVVVKERSTLLGPNYSMEETNTLEAIKEAEGGILFIDEAYQLYQPNDPRDPGRLVIETLMTALADESKRDWMLIMAGYPEEMKRMFEMNPGLKSRIPASNIYIFDDFTESELVEIGEKYLSRHGYELSSDAREALGRRLARDYAKRDKSFGNARHVVNMIQTEILPAMAIRVMEEKHITKEMLTLIHSSDIPAPSRRLATERMHIGYRA